MVSDLAALRRATALAAELAARDTAWDVDHVRWTPPQGVFLRSTEPIVLLRTGNQWLGKSTVGIADVILRCLGRHPADPRGQRPPIIAWVISPTNTHSVGIQGKAWQLAPKHELAPGQAYDDVKGFRGRYAALRFANGSIIHFRTDRQGALTLSGATIDHVLIDELCSPRVYQELKKRVARRNGSIRLTLTPINAPADWLRDIAAQGEVIDLHFKCRPEYAIPEGEVEPLRDPKSGRPMDADWFAEFRASSPEDERPVVIDGEWQIEHKDRELAGWSDRYIYTSHDSLPRFAEYGLGIDYGQASDRTVAILAAYSPERGVYVLEEWVGDGKVPILEQAQAIRRMIRRRGLHIKDIGHRIGDINSAGLLGYIGSMNEALTEAMRTVAKSERDPALPPDWAFTSANKRRGSVGYRLRLLNGSLAAQRLWVHESCNRLITSMRTYKPGLKSSLVLKDPLDALGYVAETWMRSATPQPSAIELRR
jgi:hypothetical protein